VGCDYRSPSDASRPGIKDVLVSRLDLTLKGVILLASMLRTVPGIGKAQSMQARSGLYFSNPQTRVEGLIIERHEAYRIWQYDTRVRLRTVWLCGGARQLSSPHAHPRSSMNQQNLLRMDPFLYRYCVAQV